MTDRAMALSAVNYAGPHAASSRQNGSSSSSRQPAYSPPVQAILQIGYEQNLRAMTQLGLVTMHGSHSVAGPKALQTPALVKLDRETELTWVAAGRAAEKMGNTARALSCYESALQHNPQNAEALTNVAHLLRSQEDFARAAEFYTRALAVKDSTGELWGTLGHCFLMTDDLPKAYNCYQQAIVNAVDSKYEPKLWYGIGILYDRYGSLEHAEEAFASVIKMDPSFDKANEIYFRLGIIYKQQKNSKASLQCFQYILHNPPRPLTEIDVWFQIGHVYEQQQEFDDARDAYDRVLAANPNHAKVLQQLGGLYMRSRASFYDPERSAAIITKSLEHDSSDPFSWYLLGRAYMTAGNFGKAYEAYQQAVYREGKNPAFWCSIGVLYCNINQYHDSLDAYSRAIRINPYLSEVWFNLGALYESCNDQMNDAVDAYQRTLQLDPGNPIVQARLEDIRNHQQRGTPLSAPPQPRDISPSSNSWLLATHNTQPPPSLPEGEDAARPASRAAAATVSPTASHQPMPRIAAYEAARAPPSEAPRRPNSSQPLNGLDPRRTGPLPYAPPSRMPQLASEEQRPSLPQMRAQMEQHERQAHDHPGRGSIVYNPPYLDHAPPEWMRGKAATRLAQPVPRSSLGTDPYARQRMTATPPHYILPAASSSMAAAPPVPSYGALPALQSSDRELQQRRWAMEQEDRMVRAQQHVGTNGIKSPKDARKGKGRASDEAMSRKAASPKSAPIAPPPAPAPAGLTRPPSDEDNDEGANALLALAGGGMRAAEPLPSTAPAKRAAQAESGVESMKASKRSRSEGGILPAAALAAS